MPNGVLPLRITVTHPTKPKLLLLMRGYYMKKKITKNKEIAAEKPKTLIEELELEATPIGIDLGMSQIKIASPFGCVSLDSQVSITSQPNDVIRDDLEDLNEGRRRKKKNGRKPYTISFTDRANGLYYFVGAGAHELSKRRPEDFNPDRMTGVPETRAILYAGLTRHIEQFGPFTAPLWAYVGVPLAFITGEPADVDARRAEVRKWLVGTHRWEATGKSYEVTFVEAIPRSQALGAIFDFIYDERGQLVEDRKAMLTLAMNGKAIGVISMGGNTWEVQTIEYRENEFKTVKSMTGGKAVGVLRLFDIIGTNGLTYAEMDERLRAGELTIPDDAVQAWAREGTGFVEGLWNGSSARLINILLVGGGVHLASESIIDRYGGRVFPAPDPVFSIACGLKKAALNRLVRQQANENNDE